MDWLNLQHKENRIRLVAMMESGQLVDEIAAIVQSQVMAQEARASIRNRDAVPLYHQTGRERYVGGGDLSPDGHCRAGSGDCRSERARAKVWTS